MNASFATNAAANFGRGQQHGAEQILAGKKTDQFREPPTPGCSGDISSATSNATGPGEHVSATAVIPEEKTKFLIGTGGRMIQHLQVGRKNDSS